MNTAFYTGASAMIAYQRDIGVSAHNMANINTVGFKPEKTTFYDALYSSMGVKSNENSIVGHGVRLGSTSPQFSQGVINTTDNPLDFALSGNAFFCIENENGQRQYTRNGAFTIGMSQNRGYLVTGDGKYVLDKKGERIILNKKEDTDIFDLNEIQDKIGIYSFANPYALVKTEGAGFLESVLSEKAAAASDNGASGEYAIIAGALECSAVDLTSEMVNIIEAQRAFQLNAKIVQTADQIEEILNNLR